MGGKSSKEKNNNKNSNNNLQIDSTSNKGKKDNNNNDNNNNTSSSSSSNLKGKEEVSSSPSSPSPSTSSSSPSNNNNNNNNNNLNSNSHSNTNNSPSSPSSPLSSPSSPSPSFNTNTNTNSNNNSTTTMSDSLSVPKKTITRSASAENKAGLASTPSTPSTPSTSGSGSGNGNGGVSFAPSTKDHTQPAKENRSRSQSTGLAPSSTSSSSSKKQSAPIVVSGPTQFINNDALSSSKEKSKATKTDSSALLKVGIAPSAPIPNDQELQTQFDTLLNSLNVIGEHREAMNNMPKDKKWMMILAQRNIQQTASDVDHTPEEAAAMFKGGVLNPTTVTSTRIELETKPIAYTMRFVDAGGMLGIIKWLKASALLTDENTSPEDHSVQYECVRCLRAITNISYGLAEMLKYSDGFDALALCLDNVNIRMKALVLKMLAALCLVDDGHKMILDALSFRAKQRAESFRFRALIQDIEAIDNLEVQIAFMTFVNCLVNYPDEMNVRVHIRNEFLQFELMKLVSSLKSRESADLATQIKIFEEEYFADLHNVSTQFNSKVNTEDVNEMFKAIKVQILNSEAYDWFVSTFQHFMLLPYADQSLSAKYWQLIRNVVSQIAMQDKSGLDYDFHLNYKLDVAALIQNYIDKDDADLAKSRVIELEAALARHDSLVAAKEQELAKHIGLWEEKKKTWEATSKQQEENIQSLKQKIESLENSLKASEAAAAAALTKAASSTSSSTPSAPAVVAAPVAAPAPPPEPVAPPPPPPPMAGPPPPPPPSGPPGPPPPPGMSFGAIPTTPGLPAKKAITPAIKVKNLQWMKIPNNKVKETFWGEMLNDDERLLSKLSLQEIETTFAAKAAKVEEPVEQPLGPKPKPKDVELLDPKRAYNVSIMLARIPYSFQEIKSALFEMDESKLTEQLLKSFLTYCPTSEELSILAAYRGKVEELSKADRFFLETNTIDHYEDRLQALYFKHRFNDRLAELAPVASTITKASKQVIGSTKLKNIFELVLGLGNYLNGGTTRGAAYGFKLETLPKLNDTKTANNRTFLHYLAEVVDRNFPDLKDFTDQINFTIAAASLSTSTIAAECHEIRRGLETIKTNLDALPEDDGTSRDKYASVMRTFYDSAAAEFKKLEMAMAEMDEYYGKAATHYGESAKSLQPDAFFTYFKQFVESYQKCAAENISEKEKQAGAEKRAREQEELKLKLQSKKAAKEQEDTKGVMDGLIESLRTGAWRERRREGAKSGSELPPTV